MLDTISTYVYEIYKQKSVSKAAEKLFISQPALSNTLKKEEQRLGAAIFNRKTYPFSLTAEGKIYIEAIEKMMQIESKAYDRIRDISEFKGGTLKIGLSTMLSYHTAPIICKAFLAKYPETDINIITTHTDELYRLIKTKEADAIFIPTFSTPDDYICEPLFEEKFVVALKKDYPISKELLDYALGYDDIVKRSYDSSMEIENMELFKNVEFIYNSPSSQIYKKRNLLVADYDFNPHIITNTNNYFLNHNLMLAGFGALITTDANIAAMQRNDSCVYFVIRKNEEREYFSLVYSREETSSTYSLVQEFARFAKGIFPADNPFEYLKL